MSKLKKITRKIKRKYPKIEVSEKDGCVRLCGELNNWDDIVAAGQMAVNQDFIGVLNDIKLKDFVEPKIKQSIINDKKYDGRNLDVLVIGGGVVGCAILRELTRYDLKVALVEKESDVACGASGRNDGAIHVGIDLHGKSKKLAYLMRANPLYEKLSEELDFKFIRTGQYIAFSSWKFLIGYLLLKSRAKHNGIHGMKFISGKKLKELSPNINPKTKFAFYYPSGGSVCPYGMTIAYADNAVSNGGEIWLDTCVTDMNVKDGKIVSVKTNRGEVYPKVVINAAGVYADKIAEMANDRFYTIHPRRGTNSILDKASVERYGNLSISMYGNAKKNAKLHTKGGGVVYTVDGNLLIGPDAVETPNREEIFTTADSINTVLNRQQDILPKLNGSDIITYFTGVRASTYEEDFVIQMGRKTENFVHAAGIQSPGLSAAPVIAQDVADLAVKYLQNSSPVTENQNFNPKRKGVTELRSLSLNKRDELIKKNPDYGEIVCRCEEISKGEIIDALNLPLKVDTVDGIKRRVRAGMGRCQGGFCQPRVLKIISELRNKEYCKIAKKGDGKIILGKTKGEE
ncbi:MAG TPA: FAD-dependent oxidoreductase [Clostridia bacterium]|nr:FAD-dependent oxidoreductase [Clostridia bacterium]